MRSTAVNVGWRRRAGSGNPAAVDGAQAGEKQGEAEGNEDEKLKPERLEPGAGSGKKPGQGLGRMPAKNPHSEREARPLPP